MKKTYIQPKMKVVELHPHAIMLNSSPGWNKDDTAGFNEEPQDPSKFY